MEKIDLKSQKLKISVITPSFNSGSFIERAIKSVLDQDYRNWEHIIMDGESTDKTLDILKKYKHLKWVSEKDNGQADAMNKGFKRSQGEVIVYLNADDYFFPGAFSAVIKEFKKGAKFVVGDILVKSPRLKSEFFNVPKFTLGEMLRNWEPNAFPVNALGYFYLRKVQAECPFNPDNYATMDLEFLLDAAEKFHFTKINFTLGCFEDGIKTKTGVTQSKLDYWRPETFPYIEKHLHSFSKTQKAAYLKDRREGYAFMQTHMNNLNRDSFKFMDVKDLPLISVIIPTYNCAKYICRSVDSILKQGLNNLEIIVIDDKSTDNTKNIIKEKYGNNPKVKFYAQKENLKLGATRNKGLEVAKGKYVFFLDADDWLEKNTLMHLATIAEEYNAEIVACGINKVWENGEKSLYHSCALSCKGGNEALYHFSEYRIGSIAWNKLYLRDFIENNQLRFIVPYWHEDVIFTTQALYYCKKYISVTNTYCNYFQRTASIINSKPTVLHLRSYLKLYLEVNTFIEKVKLSKNEEGKELSRKLYKAHCSNDIYSKLLRYQDTHTDEEWESDCRDACYKELGEKGIALADFVICAMKTENKQIGNTDFPKKQTKRNQINAIIKNFNNKLASYNSKIRFVLFSPQKFSKKYYYKFLNCPLRQPVRRIWRTIKPRND